MSEFLHAPGPEVLQAVVDPLRRRYQRRSRPKQAIHFAESLARGEPNRKKIALAAISDKVRELI